MSRALIFAKNKLVKNEEIMTLKRMSIETIKLIEIFNRDEDYLVRTIAETTFYIYAISAERLIKVEDELFKLYCMQALTQEVEDGL